MGLDSKKRVRGGGEDPNIISSSSSSLEKHAKTKDDPNYGILDLKNNLEYKDDNGSSSSSCCKRASDPHLALGVFDFPWLKDGIISKSEDWNFEDIFSSPLALLDEDDTTPPFAFSGQCFYQSQDQADQTLLLDFPEEKVEEDVWRPQDINQEDNGLDTGGAEYCIWSSLLNQPLQRDSPTSS